MKVEKIAEGLWSWTGLHPEWTPDDGGPEGWEQEVACVYYETPQAVVLIDPLIPPEDRERFLETLDRDVERAGRPVAILLTVYWHARSADELVERYGATLWAHPESAGKRSFEVTATSLPDGVEAPFTGRLGEVVFWLPEHRALVTGDVLLGAEGGGLRVCPPSWVGEERYPRVLDSLRRLLELPVERVLVSHGRPVLQGGREALGRATT